MNKYPKYNPKKKVMLNLGCGAQRLDGYIGIDARDCGQEMVWDITKGIPFPDESVDVVFSSHFIEHMDDDQSIALFREIYRVLKVKGTTHHRCPHQMHPTSYYWGHKTFWNEARVLATNRVLGLENFSIVSNEKKISELFFTLKKMV